MMMALFSTVSSSRTRNRVIYAFCVVGEDARMCPGKQMMARLQLSLQIERKNQDPE